LLILAFECGERRRENATLLGFFHVTLFCPGLRRTLMKFYFIQY
jgi:hypothetical protein